ncbi:MAG TPA: HAD family phosphatase [Deltaproteobacteria bacterium]|nr:HAD family phosphatase [Deltaproteobacteria bacterium]
MGTEAVIFDLGGVIVDFSHMAICARLAARCGGSARRVYADIFESGLEEAYDRGLSTAEFHRLVMERTGADMPLGEFRAIWSDIFTENREVSALVEGLKGRVSLVLLSNTNELHFEHVRERFPVIGLFDELVLSYEVGLRKPDAAIFRLAVERSGTAAQRCFYVDDNAGYVEAAAALGLDSRLFESAGALARELARRGLA